MVKDWLRGRSQRCWKYHFNYWLYVTLQGKFALSIDITFKIKGFWLDNNNRSIPSLYLEAPQILPLSVGAEVLDEGGVAQVSCIVTKGDQQLRISWTFHGADILSAELGVRCEM